MRAALMLQSRPPGGARDSALRTNCSVAPFTYGTINNTVGASYRCHVKKSNFNFVQYATFFEMCFFLTKPFALHITKLTLFRTSLL